MIPFPISQSYQTSRKYWGCHLCGKRLSSKRSYDEHMNIHTKSRPFACDECEYAAASQMTLRRHKLRNHVPRTDWGYQCPHCEEKYMEPASYQQHVIARHWGYSATFGCPYGNCTFSTKSSRFFADHLIKHRTISGARTSFGSNFSQSINFEDLALYLINDECGVGHSNGKKLKRYNVGFDQAWKPRTVQRIFYRDSVRIVQEREQEVARIDVEKLLDQEEEEQQTNKQKKRKTTFQPIFNLEKPAISTNAVPMFYTANVIAPQIPQDQCVNAIGTPDWIEMEVVIDEEANKLSQLPDGQTDDFGLD